MKRCGVRMLHLKDAVNDRPPIIKKVKKVIENEAEGRKREHQEVITWIKKVVGSSIMESDSEEPPPKRTRNLLQVSVSPYWFFPTLKLIKLFIAFNAILSSFNLLCYFHWNKYIFLCFFKGSPSGKEI